jgi:hypothetical protein
MEHNKKVILVNGRSGSGKTFSLRRLIQEYGDKVAYIDADGKHALPFKGKKKVAKYIIPKDPVEVPAGLRALEQDDSIEYVIIDTLSHLLRMLEQKHVISSDDSRGAWGKVYQAILYDIIDFATHQSKKTYIFLSHIMEGDIENGKIPVKAFVKGSTKNVGIESFFNFVIYTDVAECDECEEGLKYRFQVKKTKDTTHLSVKTPVDFHDSPFTEDNDIMKILEMIEQYDEE